MSKTNVPLSPTEAYRQRGKDWRSLKRRGKGAIDVADDRFIPTTVEDILTKLNENLLRAQATGLFFKAKARVHTKDLKRILIQDLGVYLEGALQCVDELHNYFKDRDVEAVYDNPRAKVPARRI